MSQEGEEARRHAPHRHAAASTAAPTATPRCHLHPELRWEELRPRRVRRLVWSLQRRDLHGRHLRLPEWRGAVPGHVCERVCRGHDARPGQLQLLYSPRPLHPWTLLRQVREQCLRATTRGRALQFRCDMPEQRLYQRLLSLPERQGGLCGVVFDPMPTGPDTQPEYLQLLYPRSRELRLHVDPVLLGNLSPVHQHLQKRERSVIGQHRTRCSRQTATGQPGERMRPGRWGGSRGGCLVWASRSLSIGRKHVSTSSAKNSVSLPKPKSDSRLLIADCR